MDKEKSVLNDVPVDDREWKFHRGVPVNDAAKGEPAPLLDIVGACPTCSAPVYGQKRIRAGETPRVTHSCDCAHHKSIRDTMRTT